MILDPHCIPFLGDDNPMHNRLHFRGNHAKTKLEKENRSRCEKDRQLEKRYRSFT